MTWPQYRHIITQIKTAVRSNINPSAVMFNQRPKSKTDWSVFDVKLLEAYEVLEEQTCQFCGQPRWVCDAREDANWFTFKMTVAFCKGKQVKDAWEEKEQELRSKKEPRSQLKHGEFAQLTPEVDGGFIYPDKKPGDRPDRAGWLNELEARQKAEGLL